MAIGYDVPGIHELTFNLIKNSDISIRSELYDYFF